MTDQTVKVLEHGARVTVRGTGVQRITLDRRTVAKINDNRPKQVIQRRDTPVKVADRSTIVRAGNGMGVQGPPGETEGATFVATAGETIHGQRAVRVVNDQIFHPDVTNSAHAQQVVGIAMQSGPSGTQLLVRTGGQMTEPSWNWAAGPVWCGVDGQLTQDTSFTGWLLPVGRATDATTIVVDIDTPISRI